MLKHFADSASQYGLKLNYDKTKVMTWDSLKNGSSSIAVAGNRVEILGESVGEKYLGRRICFSGGHQAELQNRISSAWTAFHTHKGELCNNNYCMKIRIKLFHAVVTPTVLYGCPAWALTKAAEQQLKTQRRKMLRYVFRIFRRPSTETWVEYLSRSASTIDGLTNTHPMIDWVTESRRRKWRFAGKLARVVDGRWSAEIISWDPDHGIGRRVGRPLLRWADDIETVAGGKWVEAAQDEKLWAHLEEGYVQRLTI